jgi:large subunit ribosomal protein L15
MLEKLSPRPGARHRTKRVGRGPGSGHGKTSTRGVKGQGKRRAGAAAARATEGGQMPLVRRLPKRGFRARSHTTCEVVNLGELAAFASGATVDAASLKAKGLIRGNGAPVKILGDGDAPKGLVVKVDRVSASAREKLEAAGGKVEIAGGEAEQAS